MTDVQTKAPPLPSRAANEEGIYLLDYLLVIWRHRWMIAGLSLVAMGATVGNMLMTPRYYRASATIVPPTAILQKQSVAPGGFGGLGDFVLRSVIDKGSVAGIYVEILRSREVADTLIEKFDLMNVHGRAENRTMVRTRLAKSTDIRTTDEGAVKIAVADLDPNRAAAMANAYVAELDRQNKRLSAGEATSKRIFLEGRLKEVEAKLSRIESIPAYEAQIQEKLYESLVHECELAKIEEAKSMPTLQVLDEAVTPEMPVARGTVRKGVLAGMAAMVLGIFLAFGREFVASLRIRDRGRTPPQGDKRKTDGVTSTAVGQETPQPSSARERRPAIEAGAGAK
jgi:uncharacterized protein involved in exopolysaccharide biosynthesis